MFNVKRIGFDDQGRPGHIQIGTVADRVVMLLPELNTAGLTVEQARELAAALDAQADEIARQVSQTAGR